MRSTRCSSRRTTPTRVAGSRTSGRPRPSSSTSSKSRRSFPGDTVSIAVQDGQRESLVGGQPYGYRIQSLEQFAEADFEAYVLEATRLDGELWEVTVNPL